MSDPFSFISHFYFRHFAEIHRCQVCALHAIHIATFSCAAATFYSFVLPPASVFSSLIISRLPDSGIVYNCGKHFEKASVFLQLLHYYPFHSSLAITISMVCRFNSPQPLSFKFFKSTLHHCFQWYKHNFVRVFRLWKTDARL